MSAHVWHDRIFCSMQLRCCVNCGFILNRDQPNKTCPGPIGIGLREIENTSKAEDLDAQEAVETGSHRPAPPRFKSKSGGK